LHRNWASLQSSLVFLSNQVLNSASNYGTMGT
jgi:hypothetical protein